MTAAWAMRHKGVIAKFPLCKQIVFTLFPTFFVATTFEMLASVRAFQSGAGGLSRGRPCTRRERWEIPAAIISPVALVPPPVPPASSTSGLNSASSSAGSSAGAGGSSAGAEGCLEADAAAAAFAALALFLRCPAVAVP